MLCPSRLTHCCPAQASETAGVEELAVLRGRFCEAAAWKKGFMIESTSSSDSLHDTGLAGLRRNGARSAHLPGAWQMPSVCFVIGARNFRNLSLLLERNIKFKKVATE
eukprot:4392-Heterococcus_DN1.PRE.8